MALTKIIGEGIGTLTDDVTIPDKIIHSGDTNTAIRFPSADTVSFETGGSERARVDSSGNLLVGKTASNSDTAGFEANSTGFSSATRSNGLVMSFDRLASTGPIVEFRQGNTNTGRIVAPDASNRDIVLTSNRNMGIRVSDQELIPTDGDGALRDNACDLGHPSARWDDVRATNSSIQTSDKNDKQDIEELTDAEKRVAVVAKGLIRKFRWKDAVAKKGDNARTHFGIIAQDLQDAFTEEKLDITKYAMFCSDTWWEKEISVDAVEADEKNGIEARDAYTYMDIKEEATEGYTEKTRLGVRYSELLAFIISAI